MKTIYDLSDAELAVVAHQLRTEVTFKRTESLLAAKGIGVLLLKGPHLGNTIYNSPRERPYNDLDILVRPRDFEIAVAALLESDFQPLAYAGFSPEVQRDFKHWEFLSPWGVMVELHRWLSGHDRFDLDIDGLFLRAESFMFGETPALGLGREDLLLHLCLHMGTSYFMLIQRKHVLDIALLIGKSPLDWPVFLTRVKQAGTGAITYYSLKAAELQDKAVVPAEVFDILRPSFFRRGWLEKFIDPATFPIYRFPEHSWGRAKRLLLLPLMDRPGQWIQFIARMVWR